MRVGFHLGEFNLRGTSVAVYDYANFGRELIEIEPFIFSCSRKRHESLALESFKKAFPVFLYEDLQELERIAHENQLETVYFLKEGINDGLVLQSTRTVVHSVFGYCDPHGDVYAYISEWLSQVASASRYPYVPHIVWLPEETGNLRKELGIPEEALVFGRHGGEDTFDLPFVHLVVEKIAETKPDIYFIFMNTNPFCAPRKNIIHLDPTSDPFRKRKFINTCDAMLHARKQGESFGLAVGEFSICGKPVITYGDSPERNHLAVLGDRAITYRTPKELLEILFFFRERQKEHPSDVSYWDRYSEKFAPIPVMKKFKEVFLNGS